MSTKKAKASVVSRLLSKAGFSRSKKEGALFTDGFLCNQLKDSVRIDHCIFYKNYIDADHVNEIFDSYAEVLLDHYMVDFRLAANGDVRCLVIKEKV